MLLAQAQTPGQGPIATAAAQMPAFPKGKDTDAKFYDESGKPITGPTALDKMPEAKLVLWLAGNQFLCDG